MVNINVYAEHAGQAGKLIVGQHDDLCTSDDHLHLRFETAADAGAFAHKWSRRTCNAFQMRVAAHIREEVANQLPLDY